MTRSHRTPSAIFLESSNVGHLLTVYYSADHFPDHDDLIVGAVGAQPVDTGISLSTDERDLRFAFASLIEAQAAAQRLALVSHVRVELGEGEP
jgi:hypothetical protein